MIHDGDINDGYSLYRWPQQEEYINLPLYNESEHLEHAFMHAPFARSTSSTHVTDILTSDEGNRFQKGNGQDDDTSSCPRGSVDIEKKVLF